MFFRKSIFFTALMLISFNAQAVGPSSVLVNPFKFYLNVFDSETTEPLPITAVTTISKINPIGFVEEGGVEGTLSTISEVNSALYYIVEESQPGLYKVFVDRSTWNSNAGGKFELSLITTGTCEFAVVVSTSTTSENSTQNTPVTPVAGVCKSNGNYVSGSKTPPGGSVTSDNWETNSGGDVTNMQAKVDAVEDILDAFGIDPTSLCTDTGQCQAPQKCLPEGITNPSGGGAGDDGVSLEIVDVPLDPGDPDTGGYHHYVATVTDPSKGSKFKATSCGCHS